MQNVIFPAQSHFAHKKCDKVKNSFALGSHVYTMAAQNDSGLNQVVFDLISYFADAINGVSDRSCNPRDHIGVV